MDIRSLVAALFERFPPEEAESWDRPGLLAGDPDARVTGVLCALDPLPSAITYAREQGANVLLTHHPAFLTPPSAITPKANDSSLAGSLLWQAIQANVALIALHTNLDRSPHALQYFADLLGLPYLGRATQEGYGALLDGGGQSADEIAQLLVKKLHAEPQVWGSGSTPLDRVAYLSGSMGSLGEAALLAGANGIITGEGSYHRILEILHKSSAKKRNTVVIIIGHDVSELPYGLFLQQIVQPLVEPALVLSYREAPHWHLLSAQDPWLPRTE